MAGTYPDTGLAASHMRWGCAGLGSSQLLLSCLASLLLCAQPCLLLSCCLSLRLQRWRNQSALCRGRETRKERGSQLPTLPIKHVDAQQTEKDKASLTRCYAKTSNSRKFQYCPQVVVHTCATARCAACAAICASCSCCCMAACCAANWRCMRCMLASSADCAI